MRLRSAPRRDDPSGPPMKQSRCAPRARAVSCAPCRTAAWYSSTRLESMDAPMRGLCFFGAAFLGNKMAASRSADGLMTLRTFIVALPRGSRQRSLQSTSPASNHLAALLLRDAYLDGRSADAAFRALGSMVAGDRGLDVVLLAAWAPRGPVNGPVPTPRQMQHGAAEKRSDTDLATVDVTPS